MSVRVRGTCNHPGCNLYYDTPLFEGEMPNVPALWDVVLPSVTEIGVTLCPWHSRTAKITCEGCQRMDGRCGCPGSDWIKT